MKQSLFSIVSNTPLTDSVYKMVLSGDTSAITAPGQFVNIQLTGKFLRRPISVCDYDGETLTIVYKVVGKGTEQMASMTAGETLDILTGLGNGYDLAPAGDRPVLLGGGVGGSHEELCGALSGGVLVLGLLTPQVPGGQESRKALYARTQEFRRRFQEVFGLTRCGDLLRARPGVSEKTPASARLGVTAHCDNMIVTAVEILEQMLAEQDG